MHLDLLLCHDQRRNPTNDVVVGATGEEHQLVFQATGLHCFGRCLVGFAIGSGELGGSAHCAPMKAALEDNEVGAARGLARQLEGSLYCLGPTVTEEKRIQTLRRHGQQFLNQTDHGLVVDDVGLGVDEFARLLAGGFHHFGRAVPGVGHPDTACEIQVAIAVNVVDVGSLGPLGHNGRLASLDGREVGLGVSIYVRCPFAYWHVSRQGATTLTPKVFCTVESVKVIPPENPEIGASDRPTDHNGYSLNGSQAGRASFLPA